MILTTDVTGQGQLKVKSRTRVVSPLTLQVLEHFQPPSPRPRWQCRQRCGHHCNPRHRRPSLQPETSWSLESLQSMVNPKNSHIQKGQNQNLFWLKTKHMLVQSLAITETLVFILNLYRSPLTLSLYETDISATYWHYGSPRQKRLRTQNTLRMPVYIPSSKFHVSPKTYVTGTFLQNLNQPNEPIQSNIPRSGRPWWCGQWRPMPPISLCPSAQWQPGSSGEPSSCSDRTKGRRTQPAISPCFWEPALQSYHQSVQRHLCCLRSDRSKQKSILELWCL